MKIRKLKIEVLITYFVAWSSRGGRQPPSFVSLYDQTTYNRWKKSNNSLVSILTLTM